MRVEFVHHDDRGRVAVKIGDNLVQYFDAVMEDDDPEEIARVFLDMAFLIAREGKDK